MWKVSLFPCTLLYVLVAGCDCLSIKSSHKRHNTGSVKFLGLSNTIKMSFSAYRFFLVTLQSSSHNYSNDISDEFFSDSSTTVFEASFDNDDGSGSLPCWVVCIVELSG